MKFCPQCGAQLEDTATFCSQCGCTVGAPVVAGQQPVELKKMTGLQTAAFVFMILGTVFLASGLIPLAWCIPMMISYKKKIETGQPVSVGFKICTLIFVSLIAGILMLVDKD